MKKYDVIVIGGSAAGTTAALSAKRNYPSKSILLIRKEENVLIPCSIPYVIGTVKDPMKSLIAVDKMMTTAKIDTLVAEVTGINRESKNVILDSGETIGYDKLVISTGSSPIVPPLPGKDLNNIFAIIKDVSYLQSLIDKLGQASNLCIIGCGFIGVEIAEECRKRFPQLNISIVEMQRNCLQLVYDEEYCDLAEKTLREENINLLLNEKVEALIGDGKVSSVKLQGGKTVEADIVIMGIGTKANIVLAEKSGLELGPTKGIQVNRYMQTSDENVFACGDCSEKISFFDNKPSGLKLASIASTEARIAGSNLFSRRLTNNGVFGVFATVLGENTFAAAGLTESQARENGYQIETGIFEAPDCHPGCMPGSCNLKVKLVFESGSRRLLGGQVSGSSSAGELVNTISACVRQKMNVDDLVTFQIGTHPILTASPIAYQLVNAAELAYSKMTV
jgi:pyruvate/2-oxoglutarate dehydrogenase complex dihydrolipoamide dehydrogenase (E3) component